MLRRRMNSSLVCVGSGPCSVLGIAVLEKIYPEISVLRSYLGYGLNYGSMAMIYAYDSV